MHGTLGAMHVLGLPGNPVSAYVCSAVVPGAPAAPPAGRPMSRRPPTRRSSAATCAENDERADYLRAHADAPERGPLVATPFPTAGLLDAGAARGGRLPGRSGSRSQPAAKAAAAADSSLKLGRFRRPLSVPVLKLKGCGTHIEHIVSVHDLFRPLVVGLNSHAVENTRPMLTRKQFELLRFIHERLKEAGVPPSFDEMKDALDLRSKSGIHRLITALGGARLHPPPAQPGARHRGDQAAGFGRPWASAARAASRRA